MLQLQATIATLANLNVRVERMGKDKTRPAADLKFTADVPNTVLETIAPGLLRSLYRAETEKGHQADLTAEPGTLTTPRYPKAKPWASTEDWPGYFLKLEAGEFDPVVIELDKVTLKAITVQPLNGGTCTLGFSCGGHPTGEDVGVLYELQGQDFTLVLSPPALGDLQRLREEAKAQRTAEPDPEPMVPDDASGPITDAQAGRAFPDALDGRSPGRKAGVSTLRAVDSTPALGDDDGHPLTSTAVN